MKKLLMITVTVLMLLSAVSLTALADDAAATVYVTVADAEGKLALTQASVTVTDADEDGAITVSDALYAAHEAYYDGGAEAGFASSEGEYGPKLDKLWGTENGGSYGYYVNNASAMGLGDPVKDGDFVSAFVYTDLTAWSDTYCFFDVNTVSAEAGEEITLTLSMAGYDGEYNPVTLPVEGATVTVNGKATDVKTDKDGKAVIAIAEAGTAVISATSETQTLVPPVCIATVKAAVTTELTAEITTEEETSAGETAAAETTVVTETATETAAPAPETTASGTVSPSTGDGSFLFVLTAVCAVAVISVAAVAGKRSNEE